MPRALITATLACAAACASSPGGADLHGGQTGPHHDEAAGQHVEPPPPDEVARLDLDPFYAKYTSAAGIPIVGSEQVSDYALLEAAYLIERMLDGRDRIAAAMATSRLRVIVMATTEMTTDIPEHRDLSPKAYWDKRARGLGPDDRTDAVSVGEENLLGYRGDPYPTESIFVHEFAHAIHDRGAAAVLDGFDGRLVAAYEAALAGDRWSGTYAASNHHEYWAEGVQSWFDTNRENDSEHNHIDTRDELRDYDPPLVELLVEVLGDGPWRYTLPAMRLDAPHLAGYDPTTAPVFAWPPAVIDAFAAHQRGDDLLPLAPLPLAELASARSPASSVATRVRVVNALSVHATLHWIDSDGGHRLYARIAPGTHVEQSTYAGHLWVVKDADGAPVAWFAAGDLPGAITVGADAPP